MVDFIKKNIFLTVLIIVLLVLGSIYLYRFVANKNTKYEDSTLNGKEYQLTNKVYEVNEYSNMIVSDEDMARIYLNDYINAVSQDARESYALLDVEYRNKKFGSVDTYVNYVESWKRNHTVKKYYKKEIQDYIIYGVYDTDGNFFAFKTKGVMQYSVYLDENTIEIW